MLNCWCITWPVGFRRSSLHYSFNQVCRISVSKMTHELRASKHNVGAVTNKQNTAQEVIMKHYIHSVFAIILYATALYQQQIQTTALYLWSKCRTNHLTRHFPNILFLFFTGNLHWVKYECSRVNENSTFSRKESNHQSYYIYIYTHIYIYIYKTKLNSVALVRERTIPTERPPPVGEVSANFCG